MEVGPEGNGRAGPSATAIGVGAAVVVFVVFAAFAITTGRERQAFGRDVPPSFDRELRAEAPGYPYPAGALRCRKTDRTYAYTCLVRVRKRGTRREESLRYDLRVRDDGCWDAFLRSFHRGYRPPRRLSACIAK